MAEVRPSHPTAQQLAQYGLGKLPEAELLAVHEHLAHCAACRQKVESLPADSFVGQIRAAKPATASMMPTLPPTTASTPPTPGTPDAAAADDVPAELLRSSKFAILGKLGQGGMGAVYQARHAFLGELVALKVMNAATLGNPDARARFLREMRAVGRLKHKHIVRALDAEEIGELLVLVMEFVPGIALDRLVSQRGPLPVGFACRCVAQAALGLQHAHERGMVHRDVKPGNLIVTAREKEVKLLDFGLARGPREQMEANNQTQTGALMGTPEYMAPEQAADARGADIRADVYSLGCTLYFLLAGRPPFQADSVLGTVLAHLQEEPRPLTDLRPGVPAGLWSVVARMLAKKPEQRYQTPIEVVKALQPFLEAPAKPGATVAPRPVQGPAVAEQKDSPFADLGKAPGRKPVKKAVKDRAATKAPAAWWRRPPVLAGFGAAVAALVVLASLWAGGMFKGKTRGEVRGVDKGWPQEIENSIGMKLVRIPPGTFTMGSPRGEEGRHDSDEGQHPVEITKEFWLGVHEVTQKQFKEVMGYNPSCFSRDGEGKPGAKYEYGQPGGGKEKAPADTGNFPVENVSWEEAREFCAKLSQRAEEKSGGRTYRLPSEAEWEYSCRGGAPSYQVFHFGASLSSSEANFDGNHPYGGAGKDTYRERTCKVGGYEKNRFGLYDLHGNVWEWCSDWYGEGYYGKSPPSDPKGPSEGVYRVVRGGSWYSRGSGCRSAYRSGRAPGFRDDNLGFRVTLVPSGR
jgi:formylglycine-generating enzyme required for sulfatase activity